MTERYALVGQPVSHSRSPWIHARFARATAQHLEYGLLEAPRAGFVATVEGFRRGGGRGLNVTLPFKEEAFRYCARTSERARVAGAVNTLLFGDEIYGDNTDGIGLVRDLARLGFALPGKGILLLGAGGAARGVAGPLLDAGAATLVVANRTLARAQALVARFAKARASTFDALAGPFDIVVNATSGGPHEEGPRLPPGMLGPGTLAYDMAYGRDTPFLAAARAAGAAASDGLGMLVEQAAESFFVWRGVRPETRPVLEALRRELAGGG